MNKLSLVALAREQLDLARTASAARASTTVFGGHEHTMRQTLIALCAGAQLQEHANPGEATVHVLTGRVRLTAESSSWEGRAGDLLIVPDAPHSLAALEDSAVLLTAVPKRRQ